MTSDHTTKRDDGTEIEVEYEVDSYGNPGNSWDDAGEPTIIAIISVHATSEACDGDPPVVLTAAEEERITAEIAVKEEADDIGPESWD